MYAFFENFLMNIENELEVRSDVEQYLDRPTLDWGGAEWSPKMNS